MNHQKVNITKWAAIIYGLLSSASLSLAEGGTPEPLTKDLSAAVEQINYVQTDLSAIKLSGFVDAGYTYNFYQGSNKYRTMDDTHNFGDFNLNQVKLTLQKDLTSRNEWQAGFRTDVFIGSDFGDSASTFYLKQAYVTFRAPVGNGLDFKFGTFASWVGYEMTDRPANLNITRSDLFYLTPSNFTGAEVEYVVNNTIDVAFAVVNGMSMDSNPTNFNALHSDGYGITAKINFTVPGGNANWQHDVYYSWDSANEFLYNTSSFQSKNTMVIYDGIMNWVPKFANGKLLLAATYDLGTMDGYNPNTLVDESFTFAGAALYAKYQLNELFSLAGRGSYVHTSEDSANDLWSMTLTAGFNVAENFLIRTEYRYDLGNDRIVQSNGITHNGGHTVAMEVAYTF